MDTTTVFAATEFASLAASLKRTPPLALVTFTDRDDEDVVLTGAQIQAIALATAGKIARVFIHGDHAEAGSIVIDCGRETHGISSGGVLDTDGSNW